MPIARSQLFIVARNETLSIVAMRVHNPDRSLFKIPLRARFSRPCSRSSL